MDKSNDLKNEKKQKIELQLSFPGKKEEEFLKIFKSLQEWMTEEKIPDLEISRKEERKEESLVNHDAMGPELLEILNIVLNAAAIAVFVNGFWRWLEARKRELEIELKTEEGILIKCNSKHFKPEELVKLIQSLQNQVKQKKEG